MSTSELRRGPGWWMDLDGQWNPPEEWPEANPPLPGWVRGSDGRWFDPEADVRPNLDTNSVGLSEPDAPPKQRPVPETTTLPSFDSLSAPKVTPPAAPQAQLVPQVIADRRMIDRQSNPTPAQSALSFSEATADLALAQSEAIRRRREGTMAAFVAAITASMLAAGLVLLLLLL